MPSIILENSIKEAQLLSIFKNFCIEYEKINKKNKLRNILAYSTNKNKTIFELIKREQNIELSELDVERMLELIIAFLKKSNYRQAIQDDLKQKLLYNQNFKCKFCNKDISETSHADHIVPFKYVGDELSNNWQMLCSNCNEKKSDSIDYQIKVLLNIN